MASLSRAPNGTKRILFTDGAGTRRAIHLGRVNVKMAESFRLRVEALLSAKALQQSLDPELTAWLRDLPELMYARLAHTGLVEPRESMMVTVGQLLERFDSMATVKPTTLVTYRQTSGSLLQFFGATKRLCRLTPLDADSWRKAIAEPVTVKRDDGEPATKQLAIATVAKRVRVAKSIFRRAIRWGLMPSNPFAHLRAGSQANPGRSRYITHETIRAILDACPDAHWRTVVALSRYAGLRCPSEIALLRWADLDWERRVLTVRSPKTSGHDGHAVRLVPIGPELLPILQDLFDLAEVGVEAMLPRLRGLSTNPRTTFQKIIARAGIAQWPRLFHNLRASCSCDWVERVPNHVAAGWLGHSPLIAAKHYLQTRDAHFELVTGAKADAAATDLRSETDPQKSDAESDALKTRMTQKATQHQSAPTRTNSRESIETTCITGELRFNANTRETMRSEGMTPMGFEPMCPP
ncbi:MAG: hypothetical protein EXS03_05890 [Phycisphaerales bacterium]|nr:hypothetical protein [Phycisphaerales bacterium]